MKTSAEEMNGDLVFSITTFDDEDAAGKLMEMTGYFLNTLEHVTRFHPEAVTAEYLRDLFEDLETIGMQLHWPVDSPRH
jgi:hypothetical protein